MVKALEAHAKAACSEADKRWRVQMDAATADAESLEEESHRLIFERDALVQEVASIRTDRDSLSGRCTQQEAEIERSRVAEAGARAAEREAGVNLGKAELERDELLRLVRQGVGISGENPGYILNTNAHLKELGIVDETLEWLSGELGE